MDKDSSFLSGKLDMDPNMPDQLQQHTVVLDEEAHATTSYSRVSPPKAVIDSSPLQSAMDKNKESLKVKLLVRRSIDQLVQQGIMPPLKTSPAIYEQRRQLERAKTGDLLKAKIKKRPDRVELEQRHILEHCDSNIDPSLAEKRRMLEKALLVDHLNSKISHRPGPLDLIGKNILHVEEPIERMVKEGLVDYALTLDESNVSVATPTTVGEGEDSLSSEGESLHNVAVALVSQPGHGTTLLQHQIQLQPLQTLPQATQQQQQQQQPATVLTTQPEFFALKPSIPIVTNDGTVLAAIATPVVATASTVATIATVTGATIATLGEVPMDQGITSRNTSNSSSNSRSNTTTPSSITNLRPILPTPSANSSGDILSPRPTLTMTPITSDIKLLSSGNSVSSGGGGKDKSSKKKSKSKSITKAKPIKFHEYKGPPSAYKSSSSSSSASMSAAGHGAGSSSDNNYQLIMQQQSLLEYLEEMCKKPAQLASPSSRDTQHGATDGEDVAGSDLTPIDSPLGAGGGASGGCSIATAARGKASAGNGAGTTVPPLATTPMATMDLAVETLNKLKVSQLKKYCKQYNLAVSGTKSNLIERLKPFFKSVDHSAPLPGLPGSPGLSATNGAVDQELEDSLLAEQRKRIAELQLQLKKSQEELEQFRSFCSTQFVGSSGGGPAAIAETTMAPVPPPPPPPQPSTQVPPGLAGSPFSISSNGISGDSGDLSGGAGSIEPPEARVIPVLEENFFLEGLSAADSTTVDYGHEMEEILPPELTSTSSALPVPDRSPTHRATLDKVLGQVQPTISGITMNADPTLERNTVASVSPGVALRGPMSVGVVGPNGRGGPAVGDMHDLSISLKSVNFDAVTGAGEESMQHDTIMLNDFGDIDLVDFHMHSLDSDGPFPMLTNHDPDPSSTSDHHIQPLSHQQHGMDLFGESDDPSRRQLMESEFANQQQQQQQQHHHHPQHIHSDSIHHHHHHHHQQQQQQSYVNNNDILNCVSGDAGTALRLDLLNQSGGQSGLSSSTAKQDPLESQHRQQPLRQQSDTNNNSNYDAAHSVGSFRFAMQMHQQPSAVASSSSSASSSSTSTSSSPGNCFKAVTTPSTNANITGKAALLANHHLQHNHHHHQQQHVNNLQHQQQQQGQPQMQQHQMAQLAPSASIVVSSSSSSSSGGNGLLIGDQIDSFQDNAMDFESLLTTDADTDSVLTANNCHRMVLDCAQDKPMFSYLPDNSLLDYFNEDCNGHDYEIKHLEY